MNPWTKHKKTRFIFRVKYKLFRFFKTVSVHILIRSNLKFVFNIIIFMISFLKILLLRTIINKNNLKTILVEVISLILSDFRFNQNIFLPINFQNSYYYILTGKYNIFLLIHTDSCDNFIILMNFSAFNITISYSHQVQLVI